MCRQKWNISTDCDFNPSKFFLSSVPCRCCCYQFYYLLILHSVLDSFVFFAGYWAITWEQTVWNWNCLVWPLSALVFLYVSWFQTSEKFPQLHARRFATYLLLHARIITFPNGYSMAYQEQWNYEHNKRAKWWRTKKKLCLRVKTYTHKTTREYSAHTFPPFLCRVFVSPSNQSVYQSKTDWNSTWIWALM